MTDISVYGEVAYNAFAAKQDWVFDEGGTPMPKWDDLSPEEQDLFESTARAVLRAKLKNDEHRSRQAAGLE